jgi:hypothetical protein
VRGGQGGPAAEGSGGHQNGRDRASPTEHALLLSLGSRRIMSNREPV